MGVSVWGLSSLHCGDVSLVGPSGTVPHKTRLPRVHYHLDIDDPQGLPARVLTMPHTPVGLVLG